jgi:hypothetical protein
VRFSGHDFGFDRGEPGPQAGVIFANRLLRRSPGFREMVAELQRFVDQLLQEDGCPEWQRPVARVLVERIAHGQEQPVSTRHLQDRCRRERTGGGRYWVNRPGHGTLARLLARLEALGVLTWKRVYPRFFLGRWIREARVLHLCGEALALVRRWTAVLGADWTPGLPHAGLVQESGGSCSISSVQTALVAVPPAAAETPPGPKPPPEATPRPTVPTWEPPTGGPKGIALVRNNGDRWVRGKGWVTPE